ncbi:T9SS type A sorting domain-containing protein [Flavobacterium caeni]|uniref:Por secretion system C-terminal sorting domain-containing protein n=1 Tax=Flavobacterium caeni TaxID=490189 RepID=A0A1G5EL99_9FLAO|nr:T9SS type A sorting domain-containing protein [Flavobacterium caeni]SCY27218.1 Por secretion system C-terminal sorting domain-containing protein [Flavobacterium caeni]
MRKLLLALVFLVAQTNSFAALDFNVALDTDCVPESPMGGGLSDLLACDFNGDGFANFDLSLQIISWGGGNPDYTFEFYESFAGAQTQNGAITPILNFNGFDGQVIYVRRNDLLSGNFEIASFALQVAFVPLTIDVVVNGNTITVSAFPAVQYDYSIDGGAFQTSPVFTNVGGGDHIIVVRSPEGCGELATSTTVLDATGFADSGFLAWPNPVSDFLYVSGITDVTELTLTDGSGKLVRSTRTNENNLKIDFAGLPDGLYFVRLQSDQKQQTLKIVKK